MSVNLITLSPRERQVWDAAYLSGYLAGHDSGWHAADAAATQTHRRAVRTVHAIAAIPPRDPQADRRRRDAIETRGRGDSAISQHAAQVDRRRPPTRLDAEAPTQPSTTAIRYAWPTGWPVSSAIGSCTSSASAGTPGTASDGWKTKRRRSVPSWTRSGPPCARPSRTRACETTCASVRTTPESWACSTSPPRYPPFHATVRDLTPTPTCSTAPTAPWTSGPRAPSSPTRRTASPRSPARRYDPRRHRAVWKRFLEPSAPDAEVRQFLQTYVGVALAGKVLEHELAIFTGTGRNGKSVFYNALAAALGDYASTAEPDLFMHRENAHPTGRDGPARPALGGGLRVRTGPEAGRGDGQEAHRR